VSRAAIRSLVCIAIPASLVLWGLLAVLIVAVVL
jgi:hypothetical protein